MEVKNERKVIRNCNCSIDKYRTNPSRDFTGSVFQE